MIQILNSFRRYFDTDDTDLWPAGGGNENPDFTTAKSGGILPGNKQAAKETNHFAQRTNNHEHPADIDYRF